MKILHINNSHYLVGGAERYYFQLSKLQREHGHKVAFFSMKHPENQKTYWEKYFISNLNPENSSLVNSIRIILRMTYSLEAKRKINQLLDEFRPDIVHIHSTNIFISPSVIPEIKKRGIPIVHSLHDYHLLDITRGSFFHHGNICEVTKPNKYYRAIFHKCIKRSYLATIAFVLSKYIHLLLRYHEKVDLFIAPSKFLRNKYIEYGFNPNKIVYLPYFVSDKFLLNSQKRFTHSDNYILYFGRLSPEKGTDILLEAMKELSNIRLKIVGRGPEYIRLNQKIKSLNLKNVELVNFVNQQKLRQIISNSRFTILPSIWYENFPYSVLEAFACQKPAIGSRIGGIPELIKDGSTGLLFTPRSIPNCTQKIKSLWNNKSLCEDMGKNSRTLVKKLFNSEKHFKNLMTMYRHLA